MVGAGLAGCEAALQLAIRGVPVELVEMRPARQTEAHRTGDVAELVCSNSLKSEDEANAHGLLKAELRLLGSVLLRYAERARVPGGRALVVDRSRFSAEVRAELDRVGVRVTRAEVTAVPEGLAIVATGPLTSPALADELASVLGTERLFFYDAIAPIVAADSIDRSRVFVGSRYGAGSDYLNCPLDRGQYRRLRQALLDAELHPMHGFEQGRLFDGCLPVEELARRGERTLAFGPMKPVGLGDLQAGVPAYAVVQLRRENADGTMYNLVGFQTRLTQAEQRRVLRMIPGLERAEFLRYGSMHRNTYLDSPRLLLPTLQVRDRPRLLVAGQLTGVEGYVESIGAGLVAGVNAARLALGQEPVRPPAETMVGALLVYVTRGPAGPGVRFQPMNANFGLLPPLDPDVKRPGRRQRMAERALAVAGRFADELGIRAED